MKCFAVYGLVAVLALAAQTQAFVIGPGSPDCTPEATAAGLSVADAEDCTKYSKCGVWFSAKLQCKPGLHFSPVAQKCVAPFLAGCDPNAVSPVAAEPGFAFPAGGFPGKPAAEADAAVAGGDEPDATIIV